MLFKARKNRLLNLSLGLLLICVCSIALFSNFRYVDYSDNKVPAFLKPFEEHNVWLIFTKATNQSPLRTRFRNLLVNLLNVSSVHLKFNIISDVISRDIVDREISDIVLNTNKIVPYTLYDFEEAAARIKDISEALMPYFSSKPGSYYSDALFFLSLGLHRIAPSNQHKAIMLDCDLYFKQDVALLFKEFDNFKPTALFGLAPELTTVYLHVLQKYRKTFKNSTFGEYYHDKVIAPLSVHPKGYQGYNSGVLLLNFDRIRNSTEYKNLLNKTSVGLMADKYKFRGHLGDQDFYTLLGFEHPDLVQTLHCGYNRQLCTFWKNHGYQNIFDSYFKCNHSTVVLHGNCNTRIPIN